MVIQPSQNLRGIVNQIDIGFGVQVAEDLVRILEHVEVLNLGRQAADTNRLFNCVGGPKVPCSRMAREPAHALA